MKTHFFLIPCLGAAVLFIGCAPVEHVARKGVHVAGHGVAKTGHVVTRAGNKIQRHGD
jgi:hypothetical protein